MDGRDEDLGVIVTPEAVVLDLDTGGLMTRMLAGLLDALIRIVVGLVLGVAALLVTQSDSSSTQVALYVVMTIVVFAYPIGCEALFRGRTLGKMALGLRAVTVDGAPIQFRHAFLRGLGGLIDFFFVPLGIIGLLTVWGSRRNQRLGDLIAGTLVVRARPLEYTSAAIWFPVPYGLAAYSQSIDTTPLRTDDYTVARSFLLRVNQLTTGARQAIAAQLADGIAGRLRHERPQHVAPEAFLLCVLAQYQRRTVPHAPIPFAVWNHP